MYLVEKHTICILILTELIFKSCRLHSRVEIETRTGFFQRFNSLHESSSLHLGLPSSSRCGASIYVLSTVALCLTSLFSPLLHFLFFLLFVISLFCSLYCNTASHFSCLSPRAVCCSSSSTVITAVLFAICSLQYTCLKLQGHRHCHVMRL